MNKWIAEFDLEDGDTMPEHMDLECKGAKIDFHCRPKESILDKIRSEIEQLPTSYVEIFTRHSGVKYRDMVDLGEVTRILDKYKAENEGKK